MGNKLRFTYPCIVLCAYRNWLILIGKNLLQTNLDRCSPKKKYIS